MTGTRRSARKFFQICSPARTDGVATFAHVIEVVGDAELTHVLRQLRRLMELPERDEIPQDSKSFRARSSSSNG